MLHISTIDSQTLELLILLMQKPLLSNMRLVGGTALALQIGHRKSVDLDFFGSINFDDLDTDELFSEVENITVLKRSKNINIFIINNIKVDFVNYSYKWLENTVQIGQIRLAGLQDIAAMKMAAITGRGSIKDFIDIYYLLDYFSLSRMLDLYNKKYPDGSVFLVLKSLTYFDDAEAEPLPHVFGQLSWSDVKSKIIAAVRAFNSNAH
ncbi:MAG: nucleotidyl transferase AbiEii/AbiGii toxin family protein [Bacteroidetes bacterium]|nr:nucleotidyl transferase AbiEii/AbiGii toxin family protein [Bacteroidota bacterium]